MTHDRKVSDQHTEKTVPATQRLAVRLFAGERIDITLVEGPQVADTWAFAGDDLAEYVSTAHTRSCIDRLTPRVGEAFYSNRRRPMLRIVEDSSPGVHDLLLSACDQGRYDLLGHTEPHRNCVDNLHKVSVPTVMYFSFQIDTSTSASLRLELFQATPQNSLVLVNTALVHWL